MTVEKINTEKNLSELSLGPIQGSSKHYINAKDANEAYKKFTQASNNIYSDGISVPMRKINLTKGASRDFFLAYDTSGIYTQSDATEVVDLKKGLKQIRKKNKNFFFLFH